MKNKKIVITLLLFIIFILTLFGIDHFLGNKKKTVTYDMDAKDSEHYELGEKINLDGMVFKINGLSELNENNQYELDIELEKKSYLDLMDGYSFKLAYNDKLLLRTDCAYKNDKIFVADLLLNDNRSFNQIVIIKNDNFKILATIELDNNQ